MSRVRILTPTNRNKPQPLLVTNEGTSYGHVRGVGEDNGVHVSMKNDMLKMKSGIK